MQSPLTKILCLTFNKRTEKTLNVTAGKQSLRQTCWRTYSPAVAGNHGAATSGTLSSCWWPGERAEQHVLNSVLPALLDLH